MRLISGTSDIFGKLPPGLPGSRFAVDQELFGLGGPKGKKAVKMVEDHDEVPDVAPDYGPTGQKYYELPEEQQVTRKIPGAPSDEDQMDLFGFGQDQTAPAAPPAQPAPPAVTPPAQAPAPGGKHHERNWTPIVIGVVVVAAIVAYVVWGRKSAPAGAMGGLGESKRARKFIRRQTKKLIQAGMPQKRAVAAAYSMARQKHFKVSPKPR
jgi:hypothetical protein